MLSKSAITHPFALLLAFTLFTAAAAPHASGIEVASNSSRIAELHGLMLVDNEPLTGPLVERYSNGDIKRSTTYREGKMHGVTRGWYEDGQLEYSRTYFRGLEEGTHHGWYANGKRRFEYHFVSGVSEGVQQQWYESGQLYTRFHYINGQEVGQQQMWDANGSLRANYVIRDGKRYGLPGSVGCRGVS